MKRNLVIDKCKERGNSNSGNVGLAVFLSEKADSYTDREIKAGGRKLYICIKGHLNYFRYEYPDEISLWCTQNIVWPMRK